MHEMHTHIFRWLSDDGTTGLTERSAAILIAGHGPAAGLWATHVNKQQTPPLQNCCLS